MITAVPLSLYVPGDSCIHRLHPGWKFLAVIAYIIAGTTAIHDPITGIYFLIPVIALYMLARIPLAAACSQIWPPLPLIAFLAAFQWWQRDIEAAAAIFLMLFSAMMAALLVTLTTTIAELLQGIEEVLSPLTRIGVPADRISLGLALTLRLIPRQLATVNDVLQARRARGAGYSAVAFLTPVIIRSLRRAELIAEALVARGAADGKED